MLATHHLKFQDSTLKVSGIQKVIDFNVPKFLICSKTIQLRQILWACPNSAADIRKWREESAKAKDQVKNGTFKFEDQFPEKFDAYIKSVLLPQVEDIENCVEKSDIRYLATTPVSSLGVVHEVYKRGFETGFMNRLKSRTLQPNAMAYANHGEILLKQAGRYRSFDSNIPRTKFLDNEAFQEIKEDLDGTFLMFTAKVESMNVSSGIIAQGLPSITAIGGFVHMLERETMQNIEFAVGFKNVFVHDGKLRYIDQSQKNKAGLKKGITANTRATFGETTATAEIVLLLKTQNLYKSKPMLKLREFLQENMEFRIAGGLVWDSQVKYTNLRNYDFSKIKWLYSYKHFRDKIDNYFIENTNVMVHQTKDNQKITFERKSDLLDCAISLHYKRDTGVSYSIVSNGYIFLEEPKERYGFRTNGHDHVFSEPSFCLICVSTEIAFKNLFWKRHNHKNSVFWI